MEEIKERYVTPRVAELLKGAGFPQDPCICNTAYTMRGKLSNNAKSFMHPSYLLKRLCTIAPTQQMAREWIEVVHKLFIEVRAGVDIDANNKEIPDSVWFDYDILPIGKETVIFPERDGYVTYKHSWEAVDAALEYILEKLILPNRTEDAIKMAKIGHSLI